MYRRTPDLTALYRTQHPAAKPSNIIEQVNKDPVGLLPRPFSDTRSLFKADSPDRAEAGDAPSTAGQLSMRTARVFLNSINTATGLVVRYRQNIWRGRVTMRCSHSSPAFCNGSGAR